MQASLPGKCSLLAIDYIMARSSSSLVSISTVPFAYVEFGLGKKLCASIASMKRVSKDMETMTNSIRTTHSASKTRFVLKRISIVS